MYMFILWLMMVCKVGHTYTCRLKKIAMKFLI